MVSGFGFLGLGRPLGHVVYSDIGFKRVILGIFSDGFQGNPG